MVIDTSILRP